MEKELVAEKVDPSPLGEDKAEKLKTGPEEEASSKVKNTSQDNLKVAAIEDPPKKKSFVEETDDQLIGASGVTVLGRSRLEDAKSFSLRVDILKDVPSHHIPDMLFRMVKSFPSTIHAHRHVCTLLRWKRTKPDLEMAILAPQGDYKKGIIFYSIFEGHFNGSIYIHNREEKIEIQKALRMAGRIPIDQEYRMCRLTGMTSKSYESVKEFINRKKWCTSEDVVLWLPWYCAREMAVNLPLAVDIRELSPEHAGVINELWPEKYPGSKELIAEMIKINFSVGLFQKDNLMSWALCWYHGGIAITQTKEEAKRKGYARLVIQALTKKMGEHLLDVHLNITRKKKSDVDYFMALGFRHAFTSYNSETKKGIENQKVEFEAGSTKTENGEMFEPKLPKDVLS